MILAVDIGGTTCKLGVFNDQLILKDKWQIETDTRNHGTHILFDIYQSFNKYFENHNGSVTTCLGIGVGVPGPVDFKKGILNGAINLGWDGEKPVAEIFERLSGIPVVIDNDANLAALGEQAFGAGDAEDDVVLLTLGTGVGGGIISNHKLLHGTSGTAGEVGHIKVDHEERFLCNCGHKGCLETVASATGIKNLAEYYFANGWTDSIISNKILDGAVNSKDIMKAAQFKDPLSCLVVKDAGQYIGAALSTVSVIVNPKRFIIGGGMSQGGHLLLNEIEHFYHLYTFKPAVQNVQFKIAELGNDAGIMGAAKLTEQHILKN